jgi:hypothetical protein
MTGALFNAPSAQSESFRHKWAQRHPLCLSRGDHCAILCILCDELVCFLLKLLACLFDLMRFLISKIQRKVIELSLEADARKQK